LKHLKICLDSLL